MKNRDIVIVAAQGWDYEIGSNIKNIAFEFAKDNRVLFVNPPIDWSTVVSKRKEERTKRILQVVSGKENALSKENNNLWVFQPDFISSSINWMSDGKVFDFFNRRSNTQFANGIRKTINEIGFKDFILFNDSMMFKGLHLKEMLQPSKAIYYIRDYLIIQPYFKKHGVRLEAELIKKSDAVTANSLYLQEYSQSFNKKTFYVGQGCEVELFDESKVRDVPDDLKNIPSPVIGYVGFLTSMRLDIPLLIQIAEEEPNWNIVLVGPEDDAFKNSRLHDLKNVHFLGRKDPADLPGYIKGFDVCINPQAINPLTIGNYPRKIDEYLAMGKPTVATKTKAMEIFKDHTLLASTNEEFIQQIKEGLVADGNELQVNRKVFAQSHTWKNSVADIYKAIDSLSD